MQTYSTREVKWKRSSDGWLGGVCEGLGESFGVDPGVLRFAWLVLLFVFGTGLLLYLFFWFALPKEEEILEYHDEKLLGVCKNISIRSNIELPIVRMIAYLLFFLSGGTALLVYGALYLIMDKPKRHVPYQGDINEIHR